MILDIFSTSTSTFWIFVFFRLSFVKISFSFILLRTCCFAHSFRLFLIYLSRNYKFSFSEWSCSVLTLSFLFRFSYYIAYYVICVFFAFSLFCSIFISLFYLSIIFENLSCAIFCYALCPSIPFLCSSNLVRSTSIYFFSSSIIFRFYTIASF